MHFDWKCRRHALQSEMQRACTSNANADVMHFEIKYMPLAFRFHCAVLTISAVVARRWNAAHIREYENIMDELIPPGSLDEHLHRTSATKMDIRGRVWYWGIASRLFDMSV